MSKYETFKQYAIGAGGIAAGGAATYLTTIYIPARIIDTATAVTTTALNTTVGPTLSHWLSSEVAKVAKVAGAEAYTAAKSTGYVGDSYQAIFSSFAVGYACGSTAVNYTLTGLEKIYEGLSYFAGQWTKKVADEKLAQGSTMSVVAE